MSLRREVATKPFSSALSPAMKREFFHAPKYSDIVGVITTTAVKASSSVGSHFLADSSSSFAYLTKSVAAASRKSASGQRLGEGHLAVAVEVGLDALGLELRLGAEDRGLDQREEVARLLVLLAGLGGEAERHGALGVRAVGAGVDDHVVVGELGHARDDALHLLVGRVGLDVVALQLLDRGRDLLAVLARAASRSRSRRPRRGRSTPARRSAAARPRCSGASVCSSRNVLIAPRSAACAAAGVSDGVASADSSSPPQPTRATQARTSSIRRRDMDSTGLRN